MFDVLVRELGFDSPEVPRAARSAGYEPIADYNDNPFARDWFEKHLPERSAP